MNNKPPPSRPLPRLYLATPEVEDPSVLASSLPGLLASADVAAVLLRLKLADQRSMISRVKTLAPAIQNAGAALLLDGHVELVARAGADGAHVSGIEAIKDAVSAFKRERIVGAGGLASRHDAMVAAESGVDYVMFGEPDAAGKRPSFEAIQDRVAWWSEVFEVPCVAYADSMAEVDALGAAEFVALGPFVFDDRRGPAAAVADASARLAAETPA